MLRIVTVILALIAAISAATWLELRGPDIPYATFERRYRTAASRFVDLPGRYHVHFEDQGKRGCVR